ncbi:hypothetical protein DVB69_07655 [Sporosarcina sp. BI001-red]|nr:hypothetical protein DVB69_07655 [Sporosarcina sp. BI001-red]
MDFSLTVDCGHTLPDINELEARCFQIIHLRDNGKAVKMTAEIESIFVIKQLAYTTKISVWVTEVRNGKTYSGYLYNRGTTDNNRTSTFSGYLKTGPYAPTSQNLEK